MGKELQEQLTALHLLPELQDGGEAGKPSSASIFLWVKYQQPLENRNKTSTLLYIADCKGQNRNTRELCKGESILFQDLSAMLLQGKTGAKKTNKTIHMEGAERNRTKRFQHPHLQYISFQRSTWTHMHNQNLYFPSEDKMHLV